jgi:hypothetical protein
MKMKPTFHTMMAYSLAICGTASLAQAQFGDQPQQAQPQQEQPAQAQPGQAQPGQAQPGQAQPGQVPGQQAQPAPAQQVVAKVNGEAITQAELKAALDPQLQQTGQDDPQVVAQLRQQVLKSLIESRLVEQYVINEGPQIPDQEVSSIIDNYAEQVEAQGMKFDEFLASSGYTKQTLQRRVKGSLAWRKYQEQELTDEKLQQHFEQNKEQFPAEEFEEAKPQVAQSFVNKLWTDIVTETQPEAKIEVVEEQPAQPAPNERPAFPPQP